MDTPGSRRGRCSPRRARRRHRPGTSLTHNQTNTNHHLRFSGLNDAPCNVNGGHGASLRHHNDASGCATAAHHKHAPHVELRPPPRHHWLPPHAHGASAAAGVCARTDVDPRYLRRVEHLAQRPPDEQPNPEHNAIQRPAPPRPAHPLTPTPPAKIWTLCGQTLSLTSAPRTRASAAACRRRRTC
jgi:hypothetical protein